MNESERPAQTGLEDPIPLSALQHAVYCLRQAALIHLERVWEENRFTAEGRVLHETVDKGGRRTIKSVRRVNGLPVCSHRLGISGVADLVEFFQDGAREIAYPVEFKRGKPKLHRADEVQLCAQALCLEEMTGQAVPEGSLYYAETKRRVEVTFDDALRNLTTDTITNLAALFKSGKTPPPTLQASRCRSCSLYDLCRPKDSVKPAAHWRARMADAVASAQDFS